MSTNELKACVLLPIPSPSTLPPSSTSKAETLQGIIANLDKQHQVVRTNIIAATTRQPPTNHAQNRSKLREEGPNQDLSTKPGSLGETESQTLNTANDDDDAATTALLLSNLNADYTEDPGGADPADAPVLPPPADIKQKTPPAEVLSAQHALEQVERYDGLARQAREHYTNALERARRGSAAMMGAGGGQGYGPAPAGPRALPAQLSVDERTANVNASPGRDPRRRKA